MTCRVVSKISVFPFMELHHMSIYPYRIFFLRFRFLKSLYLPMQYKTRKTARRWNYYLDAFLSSAYNWRRLRVSIYLSAGCLDLSYFYMLLHQYFSSMDCFFFWHMGKAHIQLHIKHAQFLIWSQKNRWEGRKMESRAPGTKPNRDAQAGLEEYEHYTSKPFFLFVAFSLS